MSRHYEMRGLILHRRMHPKPYTTAWQEQRRIRSEKRAAGKTRGLHREQGRQAEGFIIRVGTDSAGGVQTVLYDPGPIDRQLWIEAARVRDTSTG